MNYSIKAHPTLYDDVLFRSRLEARWAAFFDLAGWKWEYEPIDLEGWTPDFRVVFHCGHSECNGSHTLLIEVKPYYNISEFEGLPCMDYPYGTAYDDEGNYPSRVIPADASAAFGINPYVVYWEMAHGAGGGVEENIDNWIDEDMYGRIDTLWKTAGRVVQYHAEIESSDMAKFEGKYE